MDAYNPDTSPTPTDWLRTDEGDRIELVSAYHRRKKIKLPNTQLHAVIHVVVENQLALGEETVVKTLSRLQGEGLSRHDAIHAIGSVLAENLYELMQEGVRVNWRTVSTVPRTAPKAHGQKLARRLTPKWSGRARGVVR
jgi:hypothetical protein